MQDTRPLCRLHLTLGAVAECPEGACPFWEEGGAALPPGCSLERLGVDVERPDLAWYLLKLRRQLDESRNREEREQARRAFRDLVPPGLR